MVGKKIISYIIFLVFFSFPIFGKKPIHKSVYYADSILINAVLDEWPESLIYNKVGFDYYVMNDSTHLYICMRISEQEVSRKVQRFGFTIWIDPDGKKKKRYGINFPMKQNVRLNPMKLEQDFSAYEKRTEKSALNELFEKKMLLTGFYEKDEEQIVNPEFFKGLKVAFMNLGLSGIFYEFSIELILITEDPQLYFNGEKLLSVGFESGFLDMNAQRPTGNRMKSGAMRGGGAGRSGGGGMPGGQRPPSGGQRGQGGDMNNMNQQTKYWIKSIQLCSSDNS